MCWPLDLWKSIPVAFVRRTFFPPGCRERRKKETESESEESRQSDSQQNARTCLARPSADQRGEGAREGGDKLLFRALLPSSLRPRQRGAPPTSSSLNTAVFTTARPQACKILVPLPTVQCKREPFEEKNIREGERQSGWGPAYRELEPTTCRR